MKKLLLLAVVMLSLTGCKGSTEFGECVGFGASKSDPALVYELSTRNFVWSVIFFETVIAPVVWALEYAMCPVGTK